MYDAATLTPLEILDSLNSIGKFVSCIKSVNGRRVETTTVDITGMSCQSCVRNITGTCVIAVPQVGLRGCYQYHRWIGKSGSDSNHALPGCFLRFGFPRCQINQGSSNIISLSPISLSVSSNRCLVYLSTFSCLLCLMFYVLTENVYVCLLG